MRLSATKAILERPDCVIVATVSAIYGIGDPSEYHSMILHLKQGDKLTQRDAIKRLKVFGSGGASTNAECIQWAAEMAIPLVFDIGMTEVGGVC